MALFPAGKIASSPGPEPDSAVTVTRVSCAIHCSDQSETMACAYQRLSLPCANCQAAAWVQASGTGVAADGGRPRHTGRAVGALLERAQALVEACAVERPHVHIDDLGQFGGLGCGEVARRNRSRDARQRFDTVGRLLDRR